MFAFDWKDFWGLFFFFPHYIPYPELKSNKRFNFLLSSYAKCNFIIHLETMWIDVFKKLNETKNFKLDTESLLLLPSLTILWSHLWLSIIASTKKSYPSLSFRSTIPNTCLHVQIGCPLSNPHSWTWTALSLYTLKYLPLMKLHPVWKDQHPLRQTASVMACYLLFPQLPILLLLQYLF